ARRQDFRRRSLICVNVRHRGAVDSCTSTGRFRRHAMSHLSTRRDLLRAAAVAPVLAGAAAHSHAAIKTSAHIVIAGSGLGGLAVAHRLAAGLDGARITIVDGKEEHNYQPGYTLVATGVWPTSKVRDRNADFIPPGVEWVREMVT